VKGSADAVKRIRKKVEEKLELDAVKGTLADYVRLLQLEKELDEEEPREIKVQWVEPPRAKPGK
jgi:hypothetical protein